MKSNTDMSWYVQGFGSILDLVPLAESVIKLSAVCVNCFGEGSFTKRFGLETEVCALYMSDNKAISCLAMELHFKSHN